MNIITPRRVLLDSIPLAPFAGVSYSTTVTTVTNENTSTFSAIDIGTPHKKRIIILAIYQGVNANVTSATVNDIEAFFKLNINEFSIAAVNVPDNASVSGGLATITVTAASSLRKAVSVYIAYPDNPIPLDFVTVTANTTTDANAANVKTQAGGFLVYSGGQNATLGTFTTTWNGQGSNSVVENVDAQLEATGSYTAGFINITTSDDLGDVNMAESVSGTKRLAVASWGPPRNYVA